ncbi:5'-nucleotidase C-terminal domain-containing protein [uncultured Tateyamaria sp.]|uniref:5'-nucleotidase C-terminal domain-containing protein n=1 Tax=uncultured Tateyamaria sp. TaxID=455651 RepID=UPI00261587C6|nr:5'-nucleotidase C-terminal domain-containing protein [uncultured Tateyamaria sp.]
MGSTKIHADLRILATSDIHMHVTGWDALRNTVTAGRGMDVLTHSIAAARRAAPGTCLLLDNGDTLQGTPMGDICARPRSGVPHPWPGVANALDYDALGLGNHDFDFGLPFLERIIGQLDAPVLCASLIKGTVHGAQSGVILNRQVACSDGQSRPLAIGITSVLPPQTAIWNHRHLIGRVAFDDGVSAAQRAVRLLRRDGADIVIMLCHSGLVAVPDPEGENFATAMAARVRGIDAMILGHTHKMFPAPDHDGDDRTDPDKSTVHGIPAVMPGFAAQTLGVIDLGLRWEKDKWRAASHVTALHNPDIRHLPDRSVTAIAAPAVSATRAALDAPIIKVDRGFHSYFDMLQSGTANALVAGAMRNAIADKVVDTSLSALPLLSAVAPMAVGGLSGPDHYVNVPEGVIRERHVAMMVPYPNAVWAAVMTGAELQEWAERAAAYFAPDHTPDTLLVNALAPSFNFDSLHGLDTVIDPFQPARYDAAGRCIDPDAQRIVSLSYDGIALEPTHTFLVAMTSYRGAGGGVFPGLTHDTNIVRTDIDLAQAVRAELANGAGSNGPDGSVWRFAPDLGQTVVIQTSPDAEAHLDDIAPLAPEPIGLSDKGFLNVRVTL